MSPNDPSDAGKTVGYERATPATPATTRAGDGAAGRSLSPRPAGGLAGQVVADYEVLDEIGRGGMGVVYKARHTTLHRLVALKMIHVALGAGPEVVARFLGEAEAVARLQHPNIVQVFDVGEHDGRPFLALEYVEGGSLETKIDAKPQPPRSSADLVEKLARAVHHAHQAGIVHRDLKPANVLLTREGMPKVTDFGLAKDMERAAGSGQTRAGSILGTPSYMAPEQAAGRVEEIGPPTDVYALGAILYEMLTGRPPFRGETPFETIRQVLDGEVVAPAALQPKLPRDLDTICLKCLHKAAPRRYPSAEELADDLKRYLDGEPIKARPAGRLERAVKWARRRPTLAALLAMTVVAAAALIGLGVWSHRAVTRRAEEAEAAKKEADAALAEGTRRLVRLNVANGSRLLEDEDYLGAMLWFAEALRLEQGGPEREAMHRVRLRIVSRRCPRLTRVWPHDAAVNDAAVSPDGRVVVTGCADGLVRLWDAQTGQAAGPPLDHGAPVRCLDVSADGRQIATAGGPTARVWSAANGQAGRVLAPGGRMLFVRFSPGGGRLLTGSSTGQARVWDPSSGAAVATVSVPGPVVTVAWGPDGRTFLAAGRDGTAQVAETETGQPVGPPLRHGGPLAHAALSPDGRLAATAGEDGAVRLWEVTTGAAAATLRHGGPVRHVAFAPEGRRLVTASADGTAQVWDVASGRRVGMAARHGSDVLRAVFSPDGRWFLTTSDDNTARVWDADGGVALSPPLRDNATPTATLFCPDGHRVLVASAGRLARLWDLVVPEDAAVVDATPGPEAEGPVTVTSADGRLLAVVNTGQAVRVRRASDREPVSPPLHSEAHISAAAFSPDGARLATGDEEGLLQVWEVATGKALWERPPRHASRVRSLAFSADGAWVASGGEDDTAGVWAADTGAARIAPVRLSGSIVRVELGPDGATLFTRQAGGAGRLWDAATGEPLTPLLGPGEAAAWRSLLAPDERPTKTLVGLGRVLSGQKLDEAGGLAALGPAELADEWRRLRALTPEAFEGTAEQVLAWRRRQAAASEAAGQWSAAAWHLARLIEAEPDRAEHRRRRAEALARLGEWRQAADEAGRAIRARPGAAELWYQRGVALGQLGRWDEAAADLAKAVELRADPRRAAPLPALLALEAGDRAGYAKACDELLKAARTSDDPEVVRLAVWACVLAKGGAPDAAAVATLAEKAAAGSTDAAALRALGAALYRAGRAEEAVAKLEEAARRQPGHAPTLLFLAMARQQAGQKDRAKEALTEATAASRGGAVPPSWDVNVELSVLLDEAEAAVK
jgi:WD40 repeat protein/tetratricopeptide (TPR) repeat protein